MTDIKPQILAQNSDKILSILKDIIEHESSSLLIDDYPVLIGSRAAKWHVPSFREPKDWDLLATPLQSTLFINKVMPNATFKDIKLIYYPGAGLRIVGSCIELYTDHTDHTGDTDDTDDDDNANDIATYFDIELVSDKMDLGKMKSNEAKKADEDVEFEKLNDNQQKMSAQMILEICRDVKDKTIFPLAGFSCIVAP
jgi:hypothetical protein